MPRPTLTPARFSPALVCAATTGALVVASAAAPAQAQSSLGGSLLGSSTSNGEDDTVTTYMPKKTASRAYEMSNGTVITIMDDVLGTHSRHVGFRAGDLGIMAPLGTGEEFAMIFGDSFRYGFGKGEWMSPVGVVAKMDDDGFIQILRPINKGDKVRQMITYYRGTSQLTLLPSDVINLDGTLYLQAMWNRSLHDVSETEIFKSTDNGATWKSVARTPHSYMDGLGDLITWEKGPDGYIYVMSTSFTRSNPVYLSRFKPEDMDNRGKWELYDKYENTWSDEATPVLNGVKAGEMNLRYVEGHWVMVMFNEETLSVEVRISEDIATDWTEVPVATIAKHDSWLLPKSPSNWPQPYGGYIVPGSTLDNMDIVISQWNTGDNSRYTSTQFNVKGLDTFFGIERKAVEDDAVLDVEEKPAEDTPDMEAEDNLVENKPEVLVPGEPIGETEEDSSEDSSTADGSSERGKIAAIVLGTLAAVGLAGAAAYPLYAPVLKNALPPQFAHMLP